MSSPARIVNVLRLNALLTLAEGAWVLWNLLRSPSDADAVVFLQYSASRLALLFVVLAMMAGVSFLLVKIVRSDWQNQRVGKLLLASLNRTETFWTLFLFCFALYFLISAPDRAFEILAPYRGRIAPIFIWLGISSAHWLASWLFLRWTNSHETQAQTGALTLLLVFVASRTVYDRIGFEFQVDAVNDYWQMIDPLLLQTDLWRSLLYLHSQPPMLNLFTGLVLQWFPAASQSAFHAVYFLTGLILAWSVYRLGLALELPTWLSLVASALFTISPPIVLYEHWLFYTYPVAAALALAGVALHRFVRTKKFWWGFLFFSLLAFVALSWSLFHLVWLVAIVSSLIYFMPNRKKVFLAALLPLTLVIGWYGKNYFLFGEFTASTWAGMNLSNATTYRLPSQETARLIESGELSPFAQIPSFSAPEAYFNLLPNTPLTGIPLLDETRKSNGRINFHHVIYIEVNHFYLQDSLQVIRIHPTLYLHSFVQSLYIFFHSASDYDFLDLNRAYIISFETGWNRLFFGQWDMNESLAERTETLSLRHTGWLILLGYLIAICGPVRYLRQATTALHDEKTPLLFFMAFNLIYLALVGNLFELGENNRFRFVVDSFILLSFLFVITNAIRTKRRIN